MEGVPPDDGSLASTLERSRPKVRPIRILVVVLACVVVASTAAVYLSRPVPVTPAPGPRPPTYPTPYPTLVEPLGSGNFTLTLPLLSLTNPDNASVPNVTFTSYASFSSGYSGISAINYTWTNASEVGLPVRFLLDPSETGWTAGPGWFVVQPGGACSEGCSERVWWDWKPPGLTYFPVLEIYVSYVVTRVTLAPPLDALSWLDVTYRFGGTTSGGCLGIPGHAVYCDANVSEPSAADLTPAGSVQTVPLNPYYASSVTFPVQQFVDPSQVFHLTLPPISFDAGSYGTIRAQLVSSFSWGTASDASFQVQGMADHNVTIQFYIDNRFGSLYPVLVG